MVNSKESIYTHTTHRHQLVGKFKLLQKFSAPWCLLLFLFFAQNNLSARANSYSITVNEKQALPAVLGKIEALYELEFAYSYTDFSKIEIEKGSWSGESIESFLFKLLEPHQIIFKKSSKKKFLLRIHDVQKNAYQDWDMYLEGKIFDQENRNPLSQVAVFIEETGIGTLSNEQGVFQLKVPRRHKDALLRFRLFSYKELKLPVGNASVQATFEMKANPLSLDPIKIQKNQEENPNLNSLNALPQNWEKVASASNLAGPDVVRTLQLLPGISAFDDMNAELKIRGSGGDETLIVLDGIPIYRSDHYFGIFSSVSSDYLDKVELYKNILPLEYGGKTGGMLLMEGPERLEDFSAKLDLNLLSSSANLQIPLGKKNSLILNGRTTLGNAAKTNVFESLGRETNFNNLANLDFTRLNIIQTEPDFRFYDLNAKLNISLGKNAGLHVNFFHSRDKLQNEYSTSFSSQFRDFSVLNRESFSEEQVWASTGASMQFTGLISPKWKFSGNLYVSDYEETSTLVSSLTRIRRQGIRVLERINKRDNRISDIGAGINVKRYFDKDTWEIGLNAVSHQTAVDFSQAREAVLNGEAQTSEINIYSNYQIQRGEWLVDIGNRVNYYALTEGFYFSPRIQASYSPGKNLKLKGAWGISNQFVREIAHENQLGRSVNYFIAADEDNYPVGRSENYMLGLTFTEGPWVLDIEGFYRNLDGVVEHALVRPGIDSLTSPLPSTEYKLYRGTGQSKGIDVYLGYDANNYSSWIAYTLSKNTQRFAGVFRGEDFAAQDDRRHQFKWVNSLKIGKFTFSANYIFSSGRAYLDISDLSRLQNRRDLTPENLIKRLPSYQRVDLGLSYAFSFGKNEGSLGLSVFNLANKENVDYLQFIYAIPITQDGTNTRAEVIGTQSNLLDRTLNLTFKLNLR